MNNKIKLFFTKLLLIIVIFLSIIIMTKKDESIKLWINNNLLNRNFSFTYIKNMYTKYLGTILPFNTINDVEEVFDEKLEYESIEPYKDGILLKVSNNYLVPAKYSGIVTFIGEKEDYGNTIVVEGEDITIWYCNLNTNLKLYDEVKKGENIGDTLDNKLYLVFIKDGKIVDYKEYL